MSVCVPAKPHSWQTNHMTSICKRPTLDGAKRPSFRMHCAAGDRSGGQIERALDESGYRALRLMPICGGRHRRMTESACWIGSLETVMSPVTGRSISIMRKIVLAIEAAHTSKIMTIMRLRGAL